ncbi:MAG: cupin domain-containing protein [Bacteroidota bacterium]
MKIKNNIFSEAIDKATGTELFESLFSDERVLIERIVSSGESTPDGVWLEQAKNEWVIVMQGNAVLEIETGGLHELQTGDYVHIPSGTKHRVVQTSELPQCIWLAVHWKNEK